MEELKEKIEEIVKKLESGSVPLDNAIEEFTKAMKLAKKPIIKILIGLLVGGATVLVAFLLAITLGTIFTVAALI